MQQLSGLLFIALCLHEQCNCSRKVHWNQKIWSGISAFSFSFVSFHSLLPHTHRVWGKVMFSLCNSVHRGGPPTWGKRPPPPTSGRGLYIRHHIRQGALHQAKGVKFSSWPRDGSDGFRVFFSLHLVVRKSVNIRAILRCNTNISNVAWLFLMKNIIVQYMLERIVLVIFLCFQIFLIEHLS